MVVVVSGILLLGGSVARGAGEVEIVVALEGVEAARPGFVRCALFDGAEGFPSDPSKAVARAQTPSGTERPTCRFTLSGAGPFAVSVVHDENDNGRIDTSWLGIPKEGWGVSNDVRPSLRAPRFDEAVFRTTGARTELSVRVLY